MKMNGVLARGLQVTRLESRSTTKKVVPPNTRLAKDTSLLECAVLPRIRIPTNPVLASRSGM